MGMYNDYMTKTYSINVPSGKHTIELDNNSIAYDAYEYFIDNVLTTSDIEHLRTIVDFDVYNIITTTVN